MFPPGRSVWCNNLTSGPTVRPAGLMGGHLCCRTDMCNGLLKPAIVDYSNYPQSIFDKGSDCFFGVEHRPLFLCYTYGLFYYDFFFIIFLYYEFSVSGFFFYYLPSSNNIVFLVFIFVFSILTGFICTFLTILTLY